MIRSVNHPIRFFAFHRLTPEGSPPHPRLRRASAISRFAAAAGLAALEDGGLNLEAGKAANDRDHLRHLKRRRDLHETLLSRHRRVRRAAPPVRCSFPETVFNAPASHLAAILGITGASYTLVGDGAVGLLALRLAEDLMLNENLDRCLVVGAEEADWLLCDAYAAGGFLRAAPPIELFAQPPRGMVVSEGAGAVLIGSRRIAEDR